MRANIFSILAIGLTFTGCGRPKFVTSSGGYVELSTYNGFLWKIPGSPVLGDDTIGPQQNLLYLLVVCPDLAASEKGAESRYSGRLNSYISRWGTSAGPVAIPVVWDKHMDTVTVAGKTLGRSTGSVFVVIRDRAGTLTPTQLPSPKADLGFDEALRYIQRQMSNDTIIKAIRLPQKD